MTFPVACHKPTDHSVVIANKTVTMEIFANEIDFQNIINE